MKYQAAFTDFFKSPKSTMNLLLGAVCCLIPVVGPMVVLGWLLGGFWGRTENSFETFPDFSFDRFMKYLERGLWPSLVSLVVGVVCVPVFMVVMFVLMLVIGGIFGGHGHESGGLGLLITLIAAGFGVVFFMAVTFFLTPVLLRACLMQDFASAFNFGFLKRFLSLTKNESMISILFLGAIGFAIVVIGMIPCLGSLAILAMIPVVYFAWLHLSQQLYNLYLSRGGEAVVISPKLTSNDVPPPPPAPMPAA